MSKTFLRKTLALALARNLISAGRAFQLSPVNISTWKRRDVNDVGPGAALWDWQ